MRWPSRVPSRLLVSGRESPARSSLATRSSFSKFGEPRPIFFADRPAHAPIFSANFAGNVRTGIDVLPAPQADPTPSGKPRPRSSDRCSDWNIAESHGSMRAR